MQIEAVNIEKPEDVNVVVGVSHFIKTVEDIYEALVQSSTSLKFGVAFCEASGKRLVRHDGNDEEMRLLAVKNAQAIGAGHSFVIAVRDGFPINFLNAVKMIPEVCRIVCATANQLQVLVAVTEQGRGIVGVIDGGAPLGVEGESDIAWRKDFLRKIGYKR